MVSRLVAAQTGVTPDTPATRVIGASGGLGAGRPQQWIGAFQSFVIGGEMNVDETEQHPYLLAQRDLMRRAVEAGLPVLGICLGAQMLARALDARVYRAPVRELGFKTLRLTAAGRGDTLLSAFQTGDRVFQWHEDTFDLPAGAELLATGDDVPHQAFRFGRTAWGLQFHFEVDGPGVEAWLRVAEPTLSRDWNGPADEIRDELRMYLDAQQQRSRVLLAAFAGLLESGRPGCGPRT